MRKPMNRKSPSGSAALTGLKVAASLLFLTGTLLAADPVVSNVQGLQRPGTKLVDITYDVTADTPTVGVTLRISSDGGTTFSVPATTLTGAVGANVPVGTGKVITWNAGTDWLGNYSTAMRFEVKVDDGVVPEGFAEVAAGTLPASSWAGAQAVDGFFMAKTEVTWGEWQTVRSWAAANGYDIGDVGAGGGPNRPVTNVSWYQAIKWCNARSEKEGLTQVYKVDTSVYRTGDAVPTLDSAANGYRLPSEKEWEFAARGGVKTNGYEYSGSNDINAVAWYSSNSGSSTQDVATKLANELGLSDMSGNVWEWCFDIFSGSNRVYRGGSWYDVASGCRVAIPDSYYPTSTLINIGFRVARSSIGSYSPGVLVDTRYPGQFQIIEGSYTWPEAKADAETRGGRLAVLSTRNKIDKAKQFLSASTGDGYWMGLTDQAQEGEWKWITGEALTITDWHSETGEPNNGLGGGPENAAQFARAWGWEWNDGPFSYASGYLLEFPGPTLTVSPSANGTISGGEYCPPDATTTLTATPKPGYRFTGWTRDASGTTNPLTITMETDKTVGATFAPDLSDTDGDGLTAYNETLIYGTDPTRSDTDADGLTDDFEVIQYTVISSILTWSAAKADAESKGGGLATFATQAEWNQALQLIGEEALIDVNGLWIGATDQNTEGSWTWISGEPFGFTNWAAGQPDNLNNSDFAAVAGDLGGEPGKWYDYRATTTRDGYILESGYSTNQLDPDTDGDGLNDGAEHAAGSNPFLPDTDGDGLTDSQEINLTGTNPKLADTNGDGTNDAAADQDGDGLSNLAEINQHGTDPLKADTDGDGLSDGEELSYPGSYFTLVEGAFTHAQAAADAATRRGRLASFPNANDFTRAAGRARKTTQGYLWLSLSDTVTEGTWLWSDGNAPAYARWLDGQPDGGTGENHAVLMENSNQWADAAAGFIAAGYLFERVGLDPLAADTDGDGLSDGAESNTHQTNPVLDDSDGDGLTDGAEINTHSSNPKLADTDGDGLSDFAEVVTHGTNPTAKDSDADGFDDLFEINTGFNPTQAGSTPDALSTIRTAVEFRFNAGNGASYRIEGSTDLQNWEVVETDIIGTGGVVTRFYSIENQPKRYFRVKRN
jgi:uncharacterized repeat protein (TIGR02543 family)